MRIIPEGVYLRLEPAAHLINHTTGQVRSTPAVEIHWKDGNRWQSRTFVASDEVPTLGALLATAGEWIDGSPNLEAALDVLRGKA